MFLIGEIYEIFNHLFLFLTKNNLDTFDFIKLDRLSVFYPIKNAYFTPSRVFYILEGNTNRILILFILSYREKCSLKLWYWKLLKNLLKFWDISLWSEILWLFPISVMLFRRHLSSEKRTIDDFLWVGFTLYFLFTLEIPFLRGVERCYSYYL